MRLIDADALMASVEGDRDFYKDMYDKMHQPCEQDERAIVGASYTAYGKCYHRIRTAPTIDAVEVVRCSECKFYIGSNEKCMLIDTRLHFYETDNTWVGDCFCCWGKRKEKNDE